MNLNKRPIETDSGVTDTVDNSESFSGNVRIEVVFRDLAKRLGREIAASDFVVGCVAWMTNEIVLDSLAKTADGCSIVVQKEDWLRPDSTSRRGWADRLRRKYNTLRCRFTRYAFDNVVGTLSVCGDPSIAPVRCAGNHNSAKSPAFPRMHNKFFVFCSTGAPSDYDDEQVIRPRAVWTGSFNATDNAEESLENAVIIHSHEVASSFFREWAQVMAISEPLDWESEWCAPQWRIGT